MTDIIIPALTLIGGFIAGYFTSYLGEKGKNRATIEDTKQLTEEKEKVTSAFDLDNSKRKYKYEYKSNLYFKYFNLLDEISARANEEAQVEFMPKMNKFTSDYLLADGDSSKELKAAAEFSEAINNIMTKANESLIKLKNETVALKFVAGDSVLQVLQEIEKTQNESFDLSADMMREFGNNMVSKNLDVFEVQKNQLHAIGDKMIYLKDKLTQEIRKELNEI
jgi:hypothetical protein